MEKILTYVFKEPADSLAVSYNQQFDYLFNIKFIPRDEKKMNATSMWMQVVELVKLAKEYKENKLILCSKITVLNSIKNADLLLELITDAEDLNVKLLIGSISASDATLIPLSENLFWTDSVNNFEFLVIYESCFDLILNEEFLLYNSVAECLENITSNKMLIYPMIYAESSINHRAVEIRMERLMQMQIYLQNNKLKLPKND